MLRFFFLLSIFTFLSRACQVGYEGFYDPDALHYRNVKWDPVTAPKRSVVLEVQLYKLTPQAPVQIVFDATAGGTGRWDANATLNLYLASTCQENTLLDSRHGTSKGGSRISFNFTWLAETACASQFHLEASIVWDGGKQAIALASREKNCFTQNVCCVSSGSCAASPHSICIDRTRCLSSGNSVNATVTCVANGQVCCVLSPALPSGSSPSPSSQHLAPDKNETVLWVYIMLCFIALGLMGGGYYYYQTHYRPSEILELEML